MILINDGYEKKFTKPNYVALGSFDGIHQGHLKLINKAIEISKENNGLSMVYTFTNHPLTVINKEKAPKLIMDSKTKLEILDKLGIDMVCLVDFNQEFMHIEPEEFINILVERYNAKGIIVGFNYRFGHQNRGDIKLLQELSERLNFDLHVVSPYKSANEVVSSTKIRMSITEGNVQEATELLNRPFLLRGEVIDGKKLGRTIGFPTANLKINEDMVLPKIGVYYTNVEYFGEIYKGITSVGLNPTVCGKNITVETYILNFDKNIYGDELKVYFIERIRNEEKFNSLDALKNQLYKDKEFAKKRKIQINL